MNTTTYDTQSLCQALESALLYHGVNESTAYEIANHAWREFAPRNLYGVIPMVPSVKACTREECLHALHILQDLTSSDDVRVACIQATDGIREQLRESSFRLAA